MANNPEDLLNEWKKLTTGEIPVGIAAPADIAPASAPVPTADVVSPIDVSAKVQEALANQQAVGQYVAPQIDAYVETPEQKEARQKQEQAFMDSRNALSTKYDADIADAEDRKFKSSIFAALGNYLPTAIAGATAMNTKASVKAPELPRITPTDDTGRIQSKYKTDYEGLIDQYKALKDGKLTPKDEFERQKVNAYLKQGEFKQNSTNANSATSAKLRGLGQETANENRNELSDKEQSEISDIDNTLASLKKLHASADKFKDMLGPNAAKFEELKKSPIVGGVLRKVSPIDKEYEKFRANTKAVQAEYRKLITGLTASEPERLELRSMIPDPESPYDAYKAQAEAFESRVNQLRDTKLNTMAKYQGKNIQGYGPKEEQKAPVEKKVIKTEVNKKTKQVRTTYSDGTVEVK